MFRQALYLLRCRDSGAGRNTRKAKRKAGHGEREREKKSQIGGKDDEGQEKVREERRGKGEGLGCRKMVSLRGRN